ncbi:uncharacterized protein J7T54_003812 [Emericellopsis cladophorae]|uniref:Uncharacterized protein n=1 Tax=Emericellopsis cladophorae TaxID=2686198 RepID=A0A9P9XTU3_9HYPO|nr:uncharacterized protein J7T54_003812 [Emericellopsis cladophorae]KAI6777706.1 hypothetical protein J7T54_003812 [Emericellopsis cladophorae]
MATTFSADEARAAIKEHGFFSIQDGELGKRFLEMENKKWSFSFKTVEGFNFCKANVLKDTRVQDTLSAFKRPHILADYTRLAPSRGTIFQLRRGGNDDVLLVHLWGIGSSPIYYRKSQDADLWRILATNNLWQVLGAELKAAGCLGTPINFKDGGL